MNLKKLLTGLGLSLALLLTHNLNAQTDNNRHKLGFALSGGGARGLAHIGVLEVLEENGIFPDYVSGTSMGSIVGGLYAMGYSPQEMITLTSGIEWDYYFNDSYPRSFLPIEERSKADRYQLSFAIEDGKLVIPKGLIGGKKILNLLGSLTAPVHTQQDFNQFYLPFRCVAADLETGEAYVFNKGQLHHAIRASMSIPSAFDPLPYDNRLLVDGMMARNLPVEDVWDMGSDIVIGVDVGTPLYKKDELTSVVKVLEQSSGFGMAQSTEEQRDAASILLDPYLEGYTSLSYDATDSIINRGRQTALRELPRIKRQLDSLGWQPRAIPQRPHLQKDSFYVDSLIFVSEQAATQMTIKQLTKLNVPGIVSLDELNHLMGLLYSSGFFSHVDYHFAPGASNNSYYLVFNAAPTPDYFIKLGLNYDADFKAGLLANFTARNKLVSGSILSADFRASEYPGIWLDYMLYTRTQPSVGIQLYANGQFIPGDVYENEELADEFTFQHYQVGLNLQASISRQWYVKAGVEKEIFSENPRFFSLTDQGTNLNQWTGIAQFFRDTYDRSYFPKDGSFTHLWVQYALAGRVQDEYEMANNFSTDGNLLLGGKMHKAFSLKPYLWFDWSLAAAWSETKEDHFLQQFFLGREVVENPRFFEVYGYNLTELNVTSFAYSRVQLRTQIAGSNYIGLGYNYGRWEDKNLAGTTTKGNINGIGLELGKITQLGPIRFTTEYNIDYERFNFSFFAGYRF